MTTKDLYKTSGAQIQRPSATGLIRMVEYANPEVILPELIQRYFIDVGYSSKYPNFKTLRISSVHPFALLLYQEISGNKVETNLFPSITIADTADSEVTDNFGRQYNNFMFGAEEWALLKAGIQSGRVITSDDNVARMDAAVASGGKINGVKHSYFARHNIDINIWADNKDMVSMIYDLMKHFAISSIDELHNKGIDINDPISGRRSGDINVEFGKLLYGANLTISAVIQTSSMIVDLMPMEINNIKLEEPVSAGTEPVDSITEKGDYHLLSEEN